MGAGKKFILISVILCLLTIGLLIINISELKVLSRDRYSYFFMVGLVSPAHTNKGCAGLLRSEKVRLINNRLKLSKL